MLSSVPSYRCDMSCTTESKVSQRPLRCVYHKNFGMSHPDMPGCAYLSSRGQPINSEVSKRYSLSDFNCLNCEQQ
jgi:hypothetical protein